MIFRCKLCGKIHTKGKIRIKGGCICEDCYNSFSPALQESAWELTPLQIRKLTTWFHPVTEIPFATYELLGIGMKSLIIGNKAILLKKVESAELNFHPDGRFENKQGAVSGRLTIKFKIRNHDIYIEEYLTKDWVYMKYTIDKNGITYHYPKILVDIFDAYSVIFSQNMQDAYLLYDMFYGKKQQKVSPKANPALENAMKIFNIKQPFTKAEIIKIKKNLQKKFHPDAGGTSSQFIEINNAYEILEKFAS